MISLKNLISIALKWRKMAGIGGGRRTISLPRTCHHHHHQQQHKRVANKGHFVVYSVDKKRFVVPLAYLQTSVFRELFRMSEEEFGLPSDGPIVLPFDAAFLEDVIVCIVQRPSVCNTFDDHHKALHVSLVSSKRSIDSSSDDQSSPRTIRQLLMQPFD